MKSHAPRPCSSPPQPHSLASTVAIFTTRDVAALEKVFQQLSVEDLRVLAAFPGQPHALIHAVLVCVHCLLLSLGTPKYPSRSQAVDLEASPWPLLRLELLSNAPQVYEKLHKKLQEQQQHHGKKRHHVRMLAPAQLRFVYRTLEPFYDQEVHGASPGSHGTGTEYPAALEMFARVSSISAQLAAWVLLCLAASSSTVVAAAGKRTKNRHSGSESPVRLSKSMLPPLTTEAQLYDQFELVSPVKRTSAQDNLKVVVSTRAGFKLGGRYFLFQATCSRSYEPAVQVSQSPISHHQHRYQQVQKSSSVAQWAVLRMDTIRNSDTLLRTDASSLTLLLANGGAEATKRSPNGFWNPRQRVPTVLSRALVSKEELWRRIPKFALITTLVQLGLHARVFEDPVTQHHSPAVSHVVEPPPPLIMLKFAAAGRVSTHKKPKKQQHQAKLMLVGIGNVLIDPAHSIAALRLEIQSAMLKAEAKTKPSDESTSLHDFAFLYRGALLQRALESSLSVVTLMPFALLVQLGGTGSGGVHTGATVPPPAVRQSAVQLQRLHLEISTALRNADPPNYLPHTGNPSSSVPSSLSQEVAATYYEIQQTLLEPQTSPTAAILTEFFVNWRAFVHFQLLQDSTLVLELSSQDYDHQQKTKARTRKVCKTEAQKIAEFQAESANRVAELLQSREPRVTLPSKRFNPEKEYLKPLYALADVQSVKSAILTTPFATELYQELFSGTADTEASLSTTRTRLRLVLYDDDVVVHVTSARLLLSSSPSRDTIKTQVQAQTQASSPRLQIEFERDASCPLDTLILLHNAYVWQIVSFKPTDQHKEDSSTMPEKWLQDVLRFVTHPRFDFSYSKDSTVSTFLTFFRVSMATASLETGLEASFWSKSVDWKPFLHSTDVCERIFRQKFDLLSHSHPPSASNAIDSVKFSKLLREIAIQPQFLSIGDVAFLFTSHLTSGSHYEMDFDGFMNAMTKVASLMYPAESQSLKRKTKHQAQFVAQAGLSPGLPATNNSSLARLFFERMLLAPSMAEIWQELVNSWRLECKFALLEAFACEFGAATRVQALWRRFATRRVHLQALLRLKAQRKAAITIQSLERMRRVYQPFHALKAQVTSVQLRIKARYELRRLRREKEAFVECMRVHIVHWMQLRLRVLRKWKTQNQIWVHRRERIWAKRRRLVCSSVCRLVSRSFKFSLYRAADNNSESASGSPGPVLGERASAESTTGENQEAESDQWYELEVLEPITCWWRSARVPGRLILRLISEEDAPQRAANELVEPNAVTARQHESSSSEPGSVPLIQGNRSLGLTSGPRGSKTRSSLYLNVLLRRLYLHRGSDRIEYFRNPIQTSLGKLVFNGVVSLHFHSLDTSEEAGHKDALSHVKMLQRMGLFTVLVYFPSTSQLHRHEFSANLAYEILQFMRFRHLALLPDTPAALPGSSVKEEEDQQQRLVELQGFFSSLVAIQSLVRYLVNYGLTTPKYENTPEVLAEKKSQRLEKKANEQELQRKREEHIVVFAQSRVRQILARRCRLRLALETYIKQFDFVTGGFVYVNRYSSDGCCTPVKPPSLFDCDVPLPVDEWQPVHEPISAAKQFFNPFRGVFSHFNEEKAASRIQSWFRRKMWIGISNWGLPQLVRALRFHQQIVHMSPAQLIATGDVQAMKRGAFRLHVMEHEFKGALTIYEAVLKINPEDVEALVGLAVLLIYSCQYPTKLTWPRAQSLLAQARLHNSFDESEALKSLEENCFCWKMFLEPKNAQAELLFRRAMDADPSNELVIENYRRLERERTPDGVYSFAGPSKIARWRSKVRFWKKLESVSSIPVLTLNHFVWKWCLPRCCQELERNNSMWTVMEDSAARIPSAQRFYRNSQTGMCQWQRPPDLG